MARRSATERNVRVYTVNQESRYVIVRNIPAIGVRAELVERLGLYGNVYEHRALDSTVSEDGGNSDFTEALWVKYETVNNARHAKMKLVQKAFYGSILHVTYAPEYEAKEETVAKLTERRELLLRRARGSSEHRPNSRELSSANSEQTHQPPPHAPSPESDFIGPRLPEKRPSVPQVSSEAKPASAPAQQRSKRRRI